jgi:hypothetical protein
VNNHDWPKDGEHLWGPWLPQDRTHIRRVCVHRECDEVEKGGSQGVNISRTLNVISKAWGRQTGYCFFPYIDRKLQLETGLRKAGYNEGPGRPKDDKRGEGFRWPNDREEIKRYLQHHLDLGHDVYWCPSLFEFPNRRSDVAMDEHALWADLDEADPREIADYPPTVAWESSPGRWQALWLAGDGDFQGASWPGNENQRLTYHVGADPSGWDTTQLLRLPGWPNFKPERVEANGGKPPKGKLLWSAGQTYTIDDFHDLPVVRGAVTSELTEALESEVESIDRLKVLAKLKLKMNHTSRELLGAREVSGDRSGQMWYLMRCLADAGGTTTEIVAIMRPLVWNKFAGRADEMKRLIAEASKAVASRSEDTVDQLEEEGERAKPQRLGFLLRNIKRPVWLIEGVLTEGATGFIAGEPKTWKSWFAYDMAMSVATGADYLGAFRVVNPGPVLYIQEEDPPPVLKTRGAKIWGSKAVDKFELDQEGGLFWLPPKFEAQFDPDINASVQQGVTVSDDAWQMWLDETLEAGMEVGSGVEAYRLMIIDTLMMTAGDVDENRAQEMTTKIFRPLKLLARKHNVALQVVHHMSKGDKQRMGQRMLGSVANHAWGEDSTYLTHAGGRGNVKMEFESKVAPGQIYKVGNLDNERWEPSISSWRKEDANQNNAPASNGARGAKKPVGSSRDAIQDDGKLSVAGQALEKLSGIQTAKTIAEAAGLNYQQAYRQLSRDPQREEEWQWMGASMTEYIVKDEIVIPRRMPGSGVLGAVPETFVEITFKVRGGGLPDGEVVTVDLAELVLTGEGQLTLTHLVEDPTDLDHGIDDPAPRASVQAQPRAEACSTLRERQRHSFVHSHLPRRELRRDEQEGLACQQGSEPDAGQDAQGWVEAST